MLLPASSSPFTLRETFTFSPNQMIKLLLSHKPQFTIAPSRALQARQNLHRLAIMVKDGKQIDVSFSSREEQEQWIASIREFQASVPTLQLPQMASLRQ